MGTATAKIGQDFQFDIESVSSIAAVPTILDVVCRTTGMRFAAVARVTEDRWVACGVLDKIEFGLKPGSELSLETTICNEIRQSREAVVIDNVAEDAAWCKHATPAMYGFQSYISMPIILADGSFFGTLCAIDPRPARLKTPEVTGMFRLFAELIAKHLDAGHRLAATESALLRERAESELREQFMAVLSHDLRTPMRAISCFTELMVKNPHAEDVAKMGKLVLDSATRMQALIDNLMDLARGRLTGGLPLNRNADEPLEPVLREIIEELQATEPARVVEAVISLSGPVNCDRARLRRFRELTHLCSPEMTQAMPSTSRVPPRFSPRSGPRSGRDAMNAILWDLESIALLDGSGSVYGTIRHKGCRWRRGKGPFWRVRLGTSSAVTL